MKYCAKVLKSENVVNHILLSVIQFFGIPRELNMVCCYSKIEIIGRDNVNLFIKIEGLYIIELMQTKGN